jgi:hypothetical protein
MDVIMEHLQNYDGLKKVRNWKTDLSIVRSADDAAIFLGPTLVGPIIPGSVYEPSAAYPHRRVNP